MNIFRKFGADIFLVLVVIYHLFNREWPWGTLGQTATDILAAFLIVIMIVKLVIRRKNG